MAQKKAKRDDRQIERTNMMMITTRVVPTSGTLQTQIFLGATAGLVAGSDKPVNPGGG